MGGGSGSDDCNGAKSRRCIVGDFDANSYASPSSLSSPLSSFPEDLLENVIASVKESGGCFIRNFVDQDTVQRLNADFEPYLERSAELKSNFWSKELRRITGCMSKSDTYATCIVGNEFWQRVGDHFLTSTLHWWVGDKLNTSVSMPQLNNTSVFRIGPGATPQALHRDDAICHTHHPATKSHTLGRDTGIGLFVAGTASTSTNGATRFIPGSHLWDYSLPPREEETIYAELQPGDAFIMLAGCYHGGSANHTSDQYRQLYTTFTGRGWCRQEENSYLTYSERDLVQRLPERLQKFMGWDLSLPFMGWVGLDNPLWRLQGASDLSADPYI